MSDRRHEWISKRAYALWEAAGRPHGHDGEHWEQAVREREEFEHEIDFLAQAHSWGNHIVENLVLVRRDWSTAHAAAESGDNNEASERFTAAMAYLDTAIEVDCPNM